MVETLNALFLNIIKSFPKSDLMLYKEGDQYRPLSTAEFGERVKSLSLGLKDLGCDKGDKLVILSGNRPEWAITDFANLCLGGVTVPVYTSLMPEQISYIINDSDAAVVVCSNQELWEKIRSIRQDLKNVKHFIAFDPVSSEDVLSLHEVMESGRRILQDNPEAFDKLALSTGPADLASIIYTSGTTGIPKGVMLSHGNFISNITTLVSIIYFSEEDTILSFLPLSHVLERMVTFAFLHKGCSIAYAESIDTVAENLLEIRPTIMVSVPRVFDKIYTKVMDNVLSSSALKKKIFFWAVKVGKEYAKKTILKQPVSVYLKARRNLAHKLVFSKIVEKTGGRARFFVSGGAPLSKDIAEFFYGIGLVVLEGYGLTETSPVIAVNTFENTRLGTVGKPIPGVEVEIAEDGEILVKGPNVMKGYYKNEAETNEVFKEGWFHTGDIGHLDEDGFLVITDRKKDIIVTSGGKNVAPQSIENILMTNPFISSAMVIGSGRKFISALIVPEFEKLEEYAQTHNISFKDRGELVKNGQILDFISAEVDRMTPHLASYEKIKKIALLDREFEIGEGEITPTLKVRRNRIEEKYKDLIDSFYKEQ